MPVLLSVICLKSAHFISCLFYAISPLGSAVFYFQDQKNHFLFEVSKLIDENKVKNETEKEIKSKIEQNRREKKTEVKGHLPFISALLFIPALFRRTGEEFPDKAHR